jgi:iron complex transport system ATP-binding protein
VLHELTLALRADRLLVLRDGAVQAEGTPAEPALRAALQATFDHAIHIDERGGHLVALPCLED